MSNSGFARVVCVEGIAFIYDGNRYPKLMIVKPSGIEGSFEGGVAYTPEKVIQVNGEAEIRKLKDFFDDVCNVLDQYREHEKKLERAEETCKRCSKYSNPYFWPNEQECAGCDNMELAMEAFEKYT